MQPRSWPSREPSEPEQHMAHRNIVQPHSWPSHEPSLPQQHTGHGNSSVQPPRVGHLNLSSAHGTREQRAATGPHASHLNISRGPVPGGPWLAHATQAARCTAVTFFIATAHIHPFEKIQSPVCYQKKEPATLARAHRLDPAWAPTTPAQQYSSSPPKLTLSIFFSKAQSPVLPV